MSDRQDGSPAVRIVQFYPVELGVTGDRGNVRALQTRLERAGIPVEVLRVGRGDPTPADIDVILFGNGPLSAMRVVMDDLQGRRAELATAVEDGAAVLAVGAGAELLSESITLLDGEVLDGLGILPLRVTRTRERRVGYIIAETEHGRLIGFEDHASMWTLDAGAQAYGRVVAGRGSVRDGDGAGESVRVGHLFATNVQGPVLPLNPQLSDELLRIAASRRGYSYQPGTAHSCLDVLATGARQAIEDRVGDEVFTFMKV